MNDPLYPPSAFTKESSSKLKFQGDRDFSFLPDIDYNSSQKINVSSQTEYTITANHGTLTTEKTMSADEVQMKIKAKKDKYLNKVNIMKQQCQEELLKATNESSEINKKFFEVICEKNSLAEELSKIKLYISGMENRDSWIEEKRRLCDEIERLKFSLSDQNSIIDSLNVQLSSIEKIQWIQERELDNDIVNNCPNKLPKTHHHYESLLRTWRHKVLSLLVQQESSTIVTNKEKHSFQLERQSLQNEIAHLQSSLEQVSLRLEVQQAQLSTNEILVEKYRRENDNLYNQLNTLNQDQEKNNGQIDMICEQLNNFQCFVEQDFLVRFNQATSKIDSFHRRLDYATSRFPMIQANLKRYRNMTNEGRFEDGRDEEHIKETSFNNIRQYEEALIITNNEVKMLRQERDRLIATLEEDSATFHDRLNRKKEELKEEMEHLRTTLTKYEISFPKISKDFELMKEENYRLKSDYDLLLSNNHSDIENLQLSLKESRRELTNLSIEYSEYKRSVSQRLKHMEEQVLCSEEKIIQCDNNWKKVCEQLSAERDLLKMTIRQEGLLSKFRTKTQDRKYTSDISSRQKGSEADNIMMEVNALADELRIDLNK